MSLPLAPHIAGTPSQVAVDLDASPTPLPPAPTDYAALLAGPGFTDEDREELAGGLVELNRVLSGEAGSSSPEAAVSDLVSFALCIHAYPLAVALLRDHRPESLALLLPAGWQSRHPAFEHIFDGVAPAKLTFRAYDPHAPQSPCVDALPDDLARLAARLVGLPGTKMVMLRNFPPRHMEQAFCAALAGSQAEAFCLRPDFTCREELEQSMLAADPLLEALGQCAALTTLQVNCAGTGQALSDEILAKGRLRELFIDFSVPADCRLDRDMIDETFESLALCGKLQNLSVVHSPFQPGDVNACLLKRLAGNASIESVQIVSSVPTSGAGPEGLTMLARTFEYLNACPKLRTFRFDCAGSPDPLASVRRVHAGSVAHKCAEPALRLANAVEKLRLHVLSLQGHEFQQIALVALGTGLASNQAIEVLDLSNAHCVVNDTPEFLSVMLPNKSLKRLLLPSGKTLAFHCEQARRYRNLEHVDGKWTIASPVATEKDEFNRFDGDGPAWVGGYAQAAHIAIVDRNHRLRLRSTRMTAGFNVAAFLAKAYTAGKEQAGEPLDAQSDIGPQLFGIAGQIVYDELTAGGEHELAIRVTETANGIGVPFEEPILSPADPS